MSEALRGAKDLEDAAAFLREACGMLDDAARKLPSNWLGELNGIPCQDRLAMVAIRIERLAGKIFDEEYGA